MYTIYVYDTDDNTLMFSKELYNWLVVERYIKFCNEMGHTIKVYELVNIEHYK